MNQISFNFLINKSKCSPIEINFQFQLRKLLNLFLPEVNILVSLRLLLWLSSVFGNKIGLKISDSEAQRQTPLVIAQP